MIPIVGTVQGHGSRRLPWHTFTLLLITIGLFAFGGPAPEGLVFDRQAIVQDEPWRLLTGHWVHGDREHLAWNLAAFGILGWMIEMSLGSARLYAALLAGTCSVTAWVWLFIPSLELYCGLSGILNTLLFVILIDGWQRSRKLIFPLVFVAAAAKIAIESVWSAAIFTHTSWPAVPEAHLAGALAGVIVMAYLYLLKRCRRYGREVDMNGLPGLKNTLVHLR
jgi:rhomboid family GlyGly-CTERM serine protease